MRALLTGVLLGVAAVAACGPREVDVRSAPATQSEVAVHVTNNLNEPVNVYVVHMGNEMFLGQVAAGGESHLEAAGIAAGTTVTLRARTPGGTRSFSRTATLTGTYNWRVP